MKFHLPSNPEDAQRLQAIALRLAALPLGQAYINSVKGDFDQPLPDVHVAFDRQMTSFMGTCYRNSKQVMLALNPEVEDAKLVSVLAHEICHIPQPRKPLLPNAQGMTTLAVACVRAMEADAFAHQFVVALGSTDDEVKRATFDAVCGKLSPEVQAGFVELATRFENAPTVSAQQQVMNDVFWLVQATRLSSYDSDTITDINGMQKGNTLEPMTPPALDRAAEFVAQIQMLPGRLPGAKYNDYLVDNPAQVAQKLLRAGDIAQMLHDPVSVIDHDSTLPYSKPPRHDSVMPRR